jgi:hypothetical protein
MFGADVLAVGRSTSFPGECLCSRGDLSRGDVRKHTTGGYQPREAKGTICVLTPARRRVMVSVDRVVTR